MSLGRNFKRLSTNKTSIIPLSRRFIYKWSRFQTTANLSRPGNPSKAAECKMLKEDFKVPRISGHDPHVTPNTIDVKKHHLLLERSYINYLHRTCSKTFPVQTEYQAKNITFAHEYLGKDYDF